MEPKELNLRIKELVVNPRRREEKDNGIDAEGQKIRYKERKFRKTRS